MEESKKIIQELYNHWTMSGELNPHSDELMETLEKKIELEKQLRALLMPPDNAPEAVEASEPGAEPAPPPPAILLLDQLQDCTVDINEFYNRYHLEYGYSFAVKFILQALL